MSKDVEVGRQVMGDKLWAVRHPVILAAFDVEHQLCQSPCGKPLEKLLGLVWPDVDGQTLVSLTR